MKFLRVNRHWYKADEKLMNSVDMAMNLANVVNLIAVLLLMRAIIKNRNILKGYSVSGTFLTFVAILGFELGFYLMGNSISFGLGLFNLFFWFMAFVFSIRNLMRERREVRKWSCYDLRRG